MSIMKLYTKEEIEKSKKVGKNLAEFFRFHTFKFEYLKNDLYDGTCPFDQFLGGECNKFEWEYCSKCNIYKDNRI